MGVNALSISTWTQNDNLIIRQQPPLSTGVTVVGTIYPNTVYIASSSSSIDNYYTGDFLRILPGSIGLSDAIYKITGYVGSSNLVNLASLNVNTTVPTIPVGSYYEILQFTKDNVYPFVYIGSTISQQEMSCYEIQLTNLILPNKTLINGGRNRVVSIRV